MAARAEAVEATRHAILDALVDLSAERLFAEITLADVADRAGVSVQTVLRQFGSKVGLQEATARYMTGVIAAERRPTDGTIDGAIEALVKHYERRGDMVLMLLAQERSDPHAAEATRTGRQVHRQWVRDTLAHGAGDELLDLLVVATDLYAWKLLRRDRGLSPAETKTRIKQLVTAVLATTGKE